MVPKLPPSILKNQSNPILLIAKFISIKRILFEESHIYSFERVIIFIIIAYFRNADSRHKCSFFLNIFSVVNAPPR